MKYVIGGVHLTVRLPIHSKPGIEEIRGLGIDWAGIINSHVTCHLTPLSHLEDKIILKIMASKKQHPISTCSRQPSIQCPLMVTNPQVYPHPYGTPCCKSSCLFFSHPDPNIDYDFRGKSCIFMTVLHS